MSRANHLCCRHGIDVFWGGQYLLPYFKTPGIKYVVTMYDLVLKRYPETMQLVLRILFGIFFRRTVLNADLIVSISNATKSELLKFYPESAGRPVKVIYPAGTMRDDGKVSSKLPPEGEFLYILGSIEPRKNILFLIKTFEALLGKRPELKLVLTGGTGWKNSDVFKYVKAKNLGGQVIFTGYLTDAEVITYMRSAVLLVFPSLYEGFGLPIVEAAGQCPVLASDIPVFRELGEYFDNLMLCDFSGDAGKTAEKLDSILSRKPLPKLAYSEGKADRFTWDRAASDLIDFIS